MRHGTITLRWLIGPVDVRTGCDGQAGDAWLGFLECRGAPGARMLDAERWPDAVFAVIALRNYCSAWSRCRGDAPAAAKNGCPAAAHAPRAAKRPPRSVMNPRRFMSAWPSFHRSDHQQPTKQSGSVYALSAYHPANRSLGRPELF
jgi:hypothetical protein